MNDCDDCDRFIDSWWEAERDNTQLRAVCRYLRGEVERLERELGDSIALIEDLGWDLLGEDL